MSTILKAMNVKKIFGGGKDFSETVALNHLNLELEKGDFTAIMGPSGSGKSTLLNILSGFDFPTTGEVQIKDRPISRMSGDELAIFRRTHIGYIFQEFHLLDSLTIEENVMLPRILNREVSLQMYEKADQMLKFLGISEIKNKYPYQVSGGQQQRAAVCRALINETSLIFADEPTGNLDSKSSKSVLETLKRTNENFQTTILLVTHDPFAASYSNKVLFLKDGSIRTQLHKKGDQDLFVKEILDNLTLLEDDYDI